MKSTSTKGPDSAVEGRRQNPGQIAKNIGERQSEPQSTAQLASLVDIFAVWPHFLPSSPTAEAGPRLVDAFLFSLKIKGLITLAKPSMSTTIFEGANGVNS